MRILHVITGYLGQLFGEVFIDTLRGSLLVAGAMFVISSTGMWEYLASSLAAHDLKRGAEHVSAPPTDVVVVTIDDQAFEEHFGGQSPLERSRLKQLLEAVDRGAPAGATLVVDLDMSPVAGKATDPLSGVWQAARPNRWVIADPVLQVADPSEVRNRWREEVCAAGVSLGFPYLPFEFGYSSSTHQFAGSLADVVVRQQPACETWRQTLASGQRVDGVLQLRKVPMPLYGAGLRDPLTIPYTGDPQALSDTLSQLAPRVVVVGGTWGRSDVFNTPFGERYGVVLHAAAIQGQLEKVRLAPYSLQITLGWLLLGLLSFGLGLLRGALVNWYTPWAALSPGHRFFMNRLWPLCAAGLVLTYLLACSEALAVIRGQTGLWIPTTSVAFMVLVSVVFVWNWGLAEMPMYRDIRVAWRRVFVDPFLTDWRGLRAAARRLAGHGGELAAMSSGRAATELIWCVSSLSAQTLFPILTMYVAFTKPL